MSMAQNSVFRANAPSSSVGMEKMMEKGCYVDSMDCRA